MKFSKPLVLIFAFTFANCLAQPKMEIVGGNEHNWGKVNQTVGTVNTKIKIKNIGTEELKIYAVKPACGCTTAPIDKNSLKPGEFATIDVSLKLPKKHGSLVKPITITTNDPKKDKIDYLLKANVMVPLSTFPDFMNIGYLEVNKESLGKLVLTNNSDKPIKVLKVVSDIPELRLNIKDGTSLKAMEDFTVEARITTKNPGNIRGKVTLTTDNPDLPTFEFNIYAAVTGVGKPSGK